MSIYNGKQAFNEVVINCAPTTSKKPLSIIHNTTVAKQTKGRFTGPVDVSAAIAVVWLLLIVLCPEILCCSRLPSSD